MDFYNSRYFIINKKMLTYMGLWPYQSVMTKILIRGIFGSLVCLCLVPQMISFYKYRQVDVDKVIQSAGTLFYLTVIGLKLLTQVLAEKKIQIVYENMVTNWELLEDEKEKMTLFEYSETGRLLTIGYVSYMFSALIVFITMPCLPTILDLISPINGSRPPIFILDGEFIFDKYEHYEKVYLFESWTCIITVFIFCTVDSTYAVCVQQCVGLMAVVKSRLKNSTKLALNAKTKDDKEDPAYNGIVKSAILHKKVINFANILESSYSTSFLVIMGCNVLIVSATCIIILINMNRPLEFFRYCLFSIGLMIHMFYVSLPGQKLIDSSGSIFQDAYNNFWYECSTKTKNVLKFIMLRSIEPCQLTAGGVYVMNIANCGSLAKTSLSYITVFASFR